jgi:uncharacterized protein YecT (DUF1311 family)
MITALLLLLAAPGDELPACNKKEAEMGIQQAMNQCAYRDYMIADRELNAQWRLTRAEMQRRDAEWNSDYDDGRSGYFETLLEAQRAWLAYRDAQCRSEAYDFRGGSMETLIDATCKAALTRARTEELRQLAETYG